MTMITKASWLLFFSSFPLLAAELSVKIFMATPEGPGKNIGTINIKESEYGLIFTPNLKDLKAGVHGFHVHQNPSCDKNGMAAGGHLDPKKTNKHLGPYNNQGHLGDLPAIYVNSDGTAKIPVLAPRLKKLSEISNHALMVHEGGDTYSDQPEMGGGGKRMACGVISKTE